MGQRGFADAGHVFNQQMAAGEQTGDTILYLSVFADDDLVELA
jgi:hypothetical protein